MKNYLKPYTVCTKVEFESLLASESKGKGGGGHNGGFIQVVLLVLLTTLLLDSRAL